MLQITGFAETNIGNVEESLNNDFARYEVLETNIGTLHVAIVCDGVNNANWGMRASRLAAETILYVLRTTPENEVPHMLVGAIETANQKITETLNGEGVTTVAVAVIHVDPRTSNAQLYIASVGDSPIFLYEDGDHGQLTRLNIDHNQATLDYMEGKISYYDLETHRQTANGSVLFNALGIKQEKLQVDLGIYFQRFKNEDDTERARERGWEGLPLQEGDTVIVASDGLTGIGKNYEPYVSEHMIMEYAQDNDVERATRTLVNKAVEHGTQDNVSLVMMFMPSPYRKNVAQATSLQLPWRLIATVVIVAMLLIGIGYLITSQVNSTNENHQQSTALADATLFSQNTATADTLSLQETQMALDAELTASAATLVAMEEANSATGTAFAQSGQATLDALATADAIATETLAAISALNEQATAQAEVEATAFAAQTGTADYHNSLPTSTSTPRPTLEIVEKVVGVVYMYDADTRSSESLFEETLIDSIGETLILVDNGNEAPMNFYLAKNSSFIIDDFNQEKHSIEILLNAQANSFVETGYASSADNKNGLTFILAEDRNVRFSSQGACAGMLDLNSLVAYDKTAEETEFQTVVFSCLGGEDNCLFMDDQPIQMRTSIVWNVDEEEIIEERPIDYELANAYYEIYASYHAQNSEQSTIQIPACLTFYIDIDEDGFRDRHEDECPSQSGRFNGCPASPTPRPIVATATSVPPTAVQGPTNPPNTAVPQATNPPNTPVPPTHLPPTNPPPTNTPVPPPPTNTLVPPTSTPMPLPTRTPGPTVIGPPTHNPSQIPHSSVNFFPEVSFQQVLNQWRERLS